MKKFFKFIRKQKLCVGNDDGNKFAQQNTSKNNERFKLNIKQFYQAQAIEIGIDIDENKKLHSKPNKPNFLSENKTELFKLSAL